MFRSGRLLTFVCRLRSPELGLLGQLLRFGIAGGIVGCVYIVATLLFRHVAGLPFQLALALGFLIAYQPTAAAYHSHGEPLARHLRRIMHDAPTVLGNVLGLGSARAGEKKPRPWVLPEK